MADMKTSDMKDEITGWKAQVLALYQSLVIVIFGSLSFILRLLQEYFKMGDAKWPMSNEKVKSTNNISGKERLRSAGEMKVEKGNEMTEEVNLPSEHTVVELPPAAEQLPPSIPLVTIAEVPPKVEEPKSIIEPTVEQSKNTLVIKNLPFKFKPVDLDKLLTDNNAKPKNVRLLRDDAGRFSGMAFIRCSTKEEAQRLISNVNGLDIGGRTIQVEFKLKKKSKSKLDSSFDSLSSSSDELPGNRLRISSDTNNEPNLKVGSDNVVQSPIFVHSSLAPQNTRVLTRGNKLSVSAEHLMTDTKQMHPLKKALFQPRRKSTSNVYESNHLYVNSALPKRHIESEASKTLPSIRPIRQPAGPDGTNGFSLDYRRARGHNV